MFAEPHVVNCDRVRCDIQVKLQSCWLGMSYSILELSEASVVDEWLALQNLNHEVPGLHPVAW